MILPAGSQRDVSEAERVFSRGQQASADTEVTRLAIQVFGQPQSSAMKELLGRIPYLDLRSAEQVNFYFHGYGDPPSADNFSPERFDGAVNDLEANADWGYSGDTDLLILNSVYSPSASTCWLDYHQVVALTLENALQDKAIKAVGQFCEEIIRYAKMHGGGDPTWGFSDQKGLALLGSSLKQLVMRVLPEPLRADVEKASHLRIRDVAKPLPTQLP
jgi:hypothetical protein